MGEGNQGSCLNVILIKDPYSVQQFLVVVMGEGNQGSCLNVILIKDPYSVQQFLVVVMGEGNQGLSFLKEKINNKILKIKMIKSSDCEICVVLNRNIEMKITTDRLC